MREEKWVGRECEEGRGGGVVGLAASASRVTGLEPLWPALLLCRVLQLHGPSSFLQMLLRITFLKTLR